MHDRHTSGRRWARLLATVLAGAIVTLGLALVPSGFAKSGSGEHPGADKQQSSTHGDCKNAGTKSDTHNTTGTHNGYDCSGVSRPQGGGTDNDGDNDNPSDNDSDDQGTNNPSDNDGDHDQGGPSDNDADDTTTSSSTSGTNGTAGTNAKVINVPALQQVAGATSRRAPVACASRRRFTIHIRQIDHFRYTSATVFLGKRRLKTIRGSRRIHSGITLTGLPRGTFHVKITVHTSSGKTLRNVRTYHTCVPRRRHTTPKL